ncbi:hypothetical protein [Fluviicola sp.]|uniref:hypothetical protein n=1 Tax=Fluviicola sp. TaxID=1917219 RepID=UPI0026353CE3|nr:hypothetical protein [Fluviicola sp.]
MDVKYLIADSGGSSTTWALVFQNNEVQFVQTGSLHPKYAFSDSNIRKELEQFRGLDAPLYFYGAGCSSEMVQKEMSAFLKEAGFQETEVYPDTLAACRALYGKEAGWVGILGTGSILVQYNGSEIIRRIGGYGSLVGDEGSGFYFGKLLVRFLLETPEWENSWMELFGSKEILLSKLAGADAQKWISGLAFETAHLNIDFLHRQNAELFRDLYCSKIPDLVEIAFIGTYGFEQREIFSETFRKQKIRLKKCLANPMEDLLYYHRMNE